MVKWYFQTCWEILVRPIWFYSILKEEDWKRKSLTFLLYTAWILAAITALLIFWIQYVPIGATLVAGIFGIKFLIILPVLITMALVFLLITFFIVGGVMAVAFGAAFYLIGLLLHSMNLLLGGKGKLNLMLQSSMYSSAVLLALVFPLFFMILVKNGWLEFSLFRAGFDFIIILTIVYVYGIWAVAGRKAYDVPKWKAFVGALLPVLGLLLFLMVFDKIGIRKLEAWLVPHLK